MESPVKRTTKVLGVMSGSSLDGLDLALCSFSDPDQGELEWRVERTTSVPFSSEVRERLLHVMGGSALEIARMHTDMGVIIGEACRLFLRGWTIDLISSHGHTIFHQPNEGLTTQIGCGAQIAALTGTATVCDLRAKDVALGGQGAPLVPIGEHLFSRTIKKFLNLGGIANISFHGPNGVLGYDVCICNQALNALAEETGTAYDAQGHIASQGTVRSTLLRNLNDLPFHHLPPPRSLGREWFATEIAPLIRDGSIPLADRMRTTVEHIAVNVGTELDRWNASGSEVLITGGGYHNTFLLSRIKAHSASPIATTEHSVIDFKEAIIFAYLGYLRLHGLPNALASVTGARQDSVGGALYLPN